MSEDEFRTDLRWPTDPLGERRGHHAREIVGDEPGDDFDHGDRIVEPIAEVDDEADHVQLRQLRATVDDLRSDVSGLRADMTELLAGGLAALPTAESMTAALTDLRDEVASLRRRVTLRVEKAGGSATLSDDQLDRLADALIKRGVIPSGRRRR